MSRIVETILKHEKNKSYALNTLLSWMFALSIMIGIIYLTILDVSVANMATMTLSGVLIGAVVLYNKYTIAAATIFAAGFALYAYMSLTGDTPAYFLLEHIWSLDQTWRFMTGEIEFTRALNDSALQLIALAISLVSAVLLRLKFSYPIIFAVGAGVFLSVNIASPDGRHSAFFLLLITLLLIFIKRAKNSSKRVLVLMPLCAFVIAFASLVPMPDVSEGRRFLEDLYEEVYWIVREPFMPRHFSAYWLGFEARDGTLGGNLNPSGDFIMWVFADEPVYLAGATKSIFTGRSWESRYAYEYFTEREEPDFTGMRNFTLLSDVALYRNPNFLWNLPWNWGNNTPIYRTNMDNVRTLIHDEMHYVATPRQVGINIGRARTGTIFRPPGSLELEVFGHYGLLQRGMDLRVEPVFGRNAMYSFTFHTVDVENEYIQNVLANSHRGYYLAWLEGLQVAFDHANYHGLVLEPSLFITSEIFARYRIPYAEYVFENYTDLPDTLPERVRDLTYAITANYYTDFDRAMAIKTYLRSMPYSLTPGDLPPDRDFVDYFLFDVREGYCTYFATAMAVMARVIGIPSRYNIGFTLPERQTGNGFFAVHGVNAHAWAELYFEGVGWIIFEATPPQSQELLYYAIGSTIQYLDEWDIWLMYEYYEMDWLMYHFGGGTGATAVVAPVLNEHTADGMEVNPVLIIGLALVLALGTYMFIRKAEEDKRHKIIHGDMYRESVLESFKGLIGVLSFYGLPINSYESAIGYAKRIEKMAPLGAMQLRTTAEIFSRARYSEIEISKDDADFVKKNYFLMYKRMKDSGEKYKFFVHRYIKRL